jgi:hypothetical protein
MSRQSWIFGGGAHFGLVVGDHGCRVEMARIDGEHQPVLLAQAAGAVQIHLGAVARLVVLGRADARGELVDVVLKAGGRDDLQDPTGAVAGVPEGVPLVARLERQVTSHDVRAVFAAAVLSALLLVPFFAVITMQAVAAATTQPANLG